jgi:hypothetical protein
VFERVTAAAQQCSQADRAPFAWAALVNVELAMEGAVTACVPYKVTDPRPALNDLCAALFSSAGEQWMQRP